MTDLCEHAKEVKLPGIKHGRLCQLDNSICFHYDKPEVFKNCPTLLSKGSVIGDVTPAIGFQGIPHVVRTGRYGSFVTGMPPEYLRGELKKKKKK